MQDLMLASGLETVVAQALNKLAKVPTISANAILDIGAPLNSLPGGA